ncbi:MAG TPA: spore germination protein GerW family protein [Polyangiaceae bacterium]
MQRLATMDPTGEKIVSVANEIAAAVEREGNVRAVFGAPTKLDTRVVIPVASVAMGGGVGGVSALGAAVRKVLGWISSPNVDVEPSRTILGGGGGGIDVRPVGFLSEEDGRVVFTRIEDRPRK